MRLAALAIAVLGAPALAQTSYLGAVNERNLRELNQILVGTYSNEEQVYFEKELGMEDKFRHTREIISIVEDKDGMRFLTYGKNLPVSTRLDDDMIWLTIGSCDFVLIRRLATFSGPTNSLACRGQRIELGEHGLSISNPPRGTMPGKINLPTDPLPSGTFDRADAFTCWVAPQKRDGEYDFRNDIVLHDGGGRQWIAGEDFETVGLRMRHVRWPSGNNRDSLVLYVHKGDDTEWSRAESYAWTEPDADRIAVNLRWVQASCTRGGEIVTPGLNLKTGSGN